MTPLEALALLSAATRAAREGGEILVLLKRAVVGEVVNIEEFGNAVMSHGESSDELHGRLRDIEAGGTGKTKLADPTLPKRPGT